jgi:hypothetical protein
LKLFWGVGVLFLLYVSAKWRNSVAWLVWGVMEVEIGEVLGKLIRYKNSNTSLLCVSCMNVVCIFIHLMHGLALVDLNNALQLLFIYNFANVLVL